MNSIGLKYILPVVVAVLFSIPLAHAHGGMGMGMGMMGYGDDDNSMMGRQMMGGRGYGMGMMGGGYGMGMMGSGMGMMGMPGMGMGMMGGGYGMGMMGMGPMSMLNLTKQQRDQLTKIHRDQRDRNFDLMKKMWDEMEKLQSLYSADKLDRNAIGKAYDRIFAIKRQMIDSALDMREKLNSVLTKEQKEQLHKMPYGYGRMRYHMMDGK